MMDGQKSMNTGKGGADALKVNGMIRALLKLDLSYTEIQALFSCGKGRICRIQDPEAYKIKHSVDKNKRTHAISEVDKQVFVDFFESLDKEPGFACAHRLVQEYLTEEGVTWSALYKRYKNVVLTMEPPGRVISYTR